MNVIKMFVALVCGLFSYDKFENKDEFWEWYWEQVPDSRYPNENLYECWDTFKYVITLGGLRFDLRMWYNLHFGKKYFGYSWTFGKNGYFLKDGKSGWWFVPSDGSFTYGCVCKMTEYRNGNPIFAS